MAYRQTNRSRGMGDVGPAPPLDYNRAPALVRPGQNPQPHQHQHHRARQVRVSQYYYLEMDVPFTSTSGENKLASTVVENFNMRIRGAWSNLTSPRVRLIGNMSGTPLSTVAVPLRTFASNSTLYDQLLIWRRPFLLSGGSGLRGEFVNDGSEASGYVVFFTERPETDQIVTVERAQHYVALLDLGLNGSPTQKVTPATLQIENDLLIYGCLSTVSGATVKFIDTRTNTPWSRNELPIGAFAGISNTTYPAAVMWYPTPYLLHRNSSIRAEVTNAGSETGGYFAFICERVLNGESPAVQVAATPNGPRLVQVPQPKQQQQPYNDGGYQANNDCPPGQYLAGGYVDALGVFHPTCRSIYDR